MKNSQLNELLRSARGPDWPAEYWEQFPQTVLERAAQPGLDAEPVAAPPERPSPGWIALFWARPATALFALAALVGCAMLALRFAPLSARHTAQIEPAEVARAQRYYNEISSLFPNQVEAILFEAGATTLRLADGPNVAPALPVYVKICGKSGCRSFVTFSGQQVRLNGHECEVLVSVGGEVILDGPGLVWSSRRPGAAHSEYRIQAMSLNTHS